LQISDRDRDLLSRRVPWEGAGERQQMKLGRLILIYNQMLECRVLATPISESLGRGVVYYPAILGLIPLNDSQAASQHLLEKQLGQRRP